MQVELEVRRDGEVPRRLVLGPGVTHLGRAPDNDLVLPDVGVSRRHARLVVREGAAVLEDLGSGNGTFVRGERIRRHPVADGDQVVIDPFVLQFHLVVPAQDERRPEEEETAVMDQVASGVELDDLRRGRLVVLQGHGLVAAYPLGPQGLTLGRSDERDIVLHEPAASRMQADIRAQDGVYWLRDFGSANGTFINGRRVRERPLQHGDRIRIGSTEFRFELQDVGSPGPAVPATPMSPLPAAAAAGHAAAATPAPVYEAPLPSGVTAAGHSVNVAGPPAARRGGRGPWIALGAVVALALLGTGGMGLGWFAWNRWGEALQSGLVEAEGVAAAEVTAAKPPPAEVPAAEVTAAKPPPAEVAAPKPPPAEPAAAKPPPAEVAAAKPPPAELAAAKPPPTEAPAVAPAAAAPAAAPAAAAGSTEALMASGMAQFRKAAYLEATALFYKALKQDPDNVEAERMCYVSCEFLAIRQLRDDLAARQVPPEERERLYTEAVQQGRRALRGRSDPDAAEAAIEAALAWYPEDPTLVELQRGIQSRRARSGEASPSAAQASADPSTATASSAEARLARQYLDEGLQAIQDGRFVVARDRLGRAVALDGKLTAARSNLADVERVLEDRARNAWAQGQSLEARGDKSGAISAYQQVVSYAGASQGSLKQQAQERLDALGA